MKSAPLWNLTPSRSSKSQTVVAFLDVPVGGKARRERAFRIAVHQGFVDVVVEVVGHALVLGVRVQGQRIGREPNGLFPHWRR